MDVRQVSHFLAILDAGGVARAARSVGLTQQALSKSLERLEVQLGAPLFERTARGMTPTAFARAIEDQARAVAAEAARLDQAARTARNLDHGRIVLGLSPLAAIGQVCAVVAGFAAARPHMRLDVETGLDRPFAKALLAGELDLAVAAATEPDSPDLVTEEIARERWVVVGARTDERLARAQDLRALAGARWLLGRNMGALEGAIARTFLEAGLAAPDAMVRTTSAPFALQALASGPWLSILPKTLAEQSPGLQMRDLGGPDWSTPLILMRRKSTRGPDLARMLADKISASCRAN